MARARRTGATAAAMVVAALAFGTARPSRAEAPDKAACVAAHERGQIDRKAGRLQAARDAFGACAHRACPPVARSDCAAWLGEVEAALPTIVVEVRLEGRLVQDVRVLLDGAPLVERLEEGSAIVLDPGPHVLRVERSGARAAVTEILVVPAEKNRRVPIDLEPEAPPPAAVGPSTGPEPRPPGSRRLPAPPSPPETARAHRPPALAYALGGVALAGVGTFAFLGLRGVSDEDRLRRQCAPSCDRAGVNDLVAEYRGADIALGIGVLAAGIATVLVLTR